MDVALGAGATVAIVEGADAAAAAKPDAEKAALDETKRKRLRAAKLYVAAEKAGKKMGKGGWRGRGRSGRPPRRRFGLRRRPTRLGAHCCQGSHRRDAVERGARTFNANVSKHDPKRG